MGFQWYAIQLEPNLNLALPWWGYPTIALLALAIVALMVRFREDFALLTGRQWLGLGALILLAPFFTVIGILDLNGAALALLVLLPALVAAHWLGRGPAILAGIVTGVAALVGGGRITQPVEIGAFAVTASLFIGLHIQGRIGRLLRQPLAASLIAVLLVGWPTTLLSLFSIGSGPALANLDRATGISLQWLGLWAAAAIAGGLLTQVLGMTVLPRRSSQTESLALPPWEQQLNLRILYALVPGLVLAAALLVGIVAVISYRVATNLVAGEIARDVANLSDELPFFIQVGRGLIRSIAQDKDFLAESDQERADALLRGVRAVPYFEQMLYIDSQTGEIAAYPPTQEDAGILLPEEEAALKLALASSYSTEITITNGEAGQPIQMSFVISVVAPSMGQPVGALVGRTVLQSNPILQPVGEALRTGLSQSGEGLIVNSVGRIVLYPSHPERVQTPFVLGQSYPLPSPEESGRLFRQWGTDGTRDLVYIAPITGLSDWSIVTIVPNEEALGLAVRIALPVLLVVLILSGAGVPLIATIMNRIVGRVENLLLAVELISQGQLDQQIDARGEDEIGRLGRAFEQMRQRLKGRLSEQERLLSVSRSVSSSLELFRALPPILSSAQDSTGAVGVRVVLRPEGEGSLQTYAAGEAATDIAVLDTQLLRLVEKQGTVVVSQIWRAAGSLDVSTLPSHIQALVAFPLRGDTLFHGVLWLAFDEERIFEQSEMNFLSTLAGQAAVAVSNARLFGRAQSERRKLETVLESTTDGLVVADDAGRIALMNPAAERIFGTRSDHAQGKSASEVIKIPELATLLMNLHEPGGHFELPGQNGATLLANASTIVGQDGRITGRVVVLRDVTPLKKLDNLKTVFLRMVSHDLRSPLTYIRGYLSMIELTGDLNERQRESIDKIEIGIDQIGQMTERLTHLSRLQFGDDPDLDYVMLDVSQVIHDVFDLYNEHGREQKVKLRAELEDGLPLLYADAMLYRQAIANLVNNAIKYSPENGEVLVRAEHNKRKDTLVVSVKDQGMGIRKEDQRRLFEAFFRVPQRDGDPPRPHGTGLGLALVKAIVDAHGGTVQIESDFGKGSVFTIILPVRRTRRG